MTGTGYSKFSDEEIDRLRSDTPGCANVIHLNNAGASLMPKPVLESILHHLALENQFGGYEAAELMADQIREFYGAAARLINCRSTNIAFTSNATDAYSRALSSIAFQAGDTILTSTNDYISNQISFLSLKKRVGVRIERIKNTSLGGVDVEDLEKKLKTLQPKLLAITHIPTNSGLVQPIEEIGQIAAQHETLYLVDACQSAGQKQLDVNAIKCDFLSATSRKFLRGPRGAGFLFVSDKALELGLEPLFIDMRGAAWTDENTYAPKPDATRFEDWEFAYSLVLGSKTAIEYAIQIGTHRIWERVQYLSSCLRDRLGQIKNLKVLDKGSELGGLVTFTIANSNPDNIRRELNLRKVNSSVSYRNFAVIDFKDKNVDWAIRLSPHYYNTLEELDTAADIIAHLPAT